MDEGPVTSWTFFQNVSSLLRSPRVAEVCRGGGGGLRFAQRMGVDAKRRPSDPSAVGALASANVLLWQPHPRPRIELDRHANVFGLVSR